MAFENVDYDDVKPIQPEVPLSTIPVDNLK